MKKESNNTVNVWRMIPVLMSMLWLLISMIGCSERYVVIHGEETVTVKKATLDNLYSDNERLLRALAECRGMQP